MNDGFVKIYGEKLLDSTLSLEEPPVRLVFLLMLAIADQDGIVDLPGVRVLARKLNLPVEYVKGALKVLMAPDPDSRTKAEEGRRIVARTGKDECGWMCVNREVYREFRGRKTELARLRMQKMRERNARNSDVGYAQENREQSKELREQRKEPPLPPSGGDGDSLAEFAKSWQELTDRSDFREFVSGCGQLSGTHQQVLRDFRRACGGSVAEFRARVSARLSGDSNGFLRSSSLMHWTTGPIQSPAEAPNGKGPATPPKDYKYDDDRTTL